MKVFYKLKDFLDIFAYNSIVFISLFSRKFMSIKYKSFSSTVIQGKAIGRTIGYPTANLELPLGSNYDFGVYFAKISCNENRMNYFGLVSIGVRPTIEEESKANAECYLLDFDGDLYGHRLEVYLLEFLRSEIKFSSIEELKAQIVKDEIKARGLIAEYQD